MKINGSLAINDYVLHPMISLLAKLVYKVKITDKA